MKKACLILIVLICGCMAGMLGLFTIAGIALFDIGMILLFGIPTALLVFVDYKIAKNLGWIKPKVKREKPVKPVVKPEPVMESEQIMFDFKEEPVKEEKPVDNVIQFKQKENKQEPKEEKQQENKEEMSLGKAILTLIGVCLAFLGIGAVIVGGVVLVGYIIYYAFIILANAFMYIIGFVLFIALAYGFLSLWWGGVRHEHIDKPRGIVRVKVKRRRW